MIIQQPEFGRRVREIRRARGLPQAELTSETVSTSYVSLVESGRRTPSVKAARAIAERLGLDLEDLGTPPAAEPHPSRMELIGRLLAARASQLAGDWERARDELQSLIGQMGSDDAAVEAEEVLWEARWELAVTLGHLDDQEPRLAVLRELLAASMTEHAPALQARVLVEMARTLRRTGRPSESVSHAEQAARITRDSSVAPADHLAALVALVSAYTESGDWERAESLGDELLADADDPLPHHARAAALWAAGGVQRLAGRPVEALDLLNRADALTGPSGDMTERARLVRARALTALEAGAPDTVRSLVEQSRTLADLLGSPAARALHASLASLASLHTGDSAQAAGLADGIDPAAPGLSLLEQAWCAVVRARTRKATGASAEDDYRHAADRYEQAGTYRLAMEAWRELHAPASKERPAVDPHALIMP
ncbi:helix-turn-helix domain-containing protein [Streptomyces sp. NPDC000070]|uniref:helix-turn-helix domain-containing protein n=1 Tax=Streptomyces sp. NPDC000070 TaxID=3154240 RepID=UPI00332616D3